MELRAVKIVQQDASCIVSLCVCICIYIYIYIYVYIYSTHCMFKVSPYLFITLSMVYFAIKSLSPLANNASVD